MEKAKSASWQTSPLMIPDREMQKWEPTHPIRQIEWTWEKNALTNFHYVNVVKALKWWKRVNRGMPKYPKGYPLEHIVGFCCPNSIGSVAVGVTETLETIVSKFAIHEELRTRPKLHDHGVPEHDVLKNLSVPDFLQFYSEAKKAAKIARSALDSDDKKLSIQLWQQLFGTECFPGTDDDDDGRGKGAYTPRTAPSQPGSGRFA
jgi:hypothetical protein